MSGDIEINEIPENYALTIRKIVKYEELADILEKGYADILEYLNEINQAPSNVPFALYHSVHMDNIDVEFGFPVAIELAGNDEIKESSVPSGLIASSVYKGPYSRMEPVYNKIITWIKENNYEASGAVYENYLNDPQTTAPEELLTRIGFILVKD